MANGTGQCHLANGLTGDFSTLVSPFHLQLVAVLLGQMNFTWLLSWPDWLPDCEADSDSDSDSDADLLMRRPSAA